MRRLQTMLIVAAAALIAACSTAQQPEEAPIVQESPLLRYLERRSGRIVYLQAAGNIAVTDQGNLNNVLITDDAVITGGEEAIVYLEPVWSPDSSEVAFARIEASQDVYETRIMAAPADGSTEPRTLYTSTTGEQPSQLDWDGDTLSFLTVFTERVVLRTASTTGDTAAVAVEAAPNLYWSMAPGGAQMLLHNPNPPQPRLSYLTFEGGISEEIMRVQPVWQRVPVFSSDGEAMLFTARIGETNSALLIADRGGVVRRRLATVSGELGATWSPDSRYVAALRFNQSSSSVPIERGTLTIYDTQNPATVITAPSGRIMAHFWAPDSRHIAYFTVDSVAEPADGSPSPDLEISLYVLDTRTERVRNVQTFQPSDAFLNTLFNFEQYSQAGTIWSPNSSLLVIAGVLGEIPRPAIYVVDAGGGVPARFIDFGLSAFWSWE